MTTLSTHVLDTALGRPAEGVVVALARGEGDDWTHLDDGVTNGDGRIGDLGADLPSGRYRLTFDVAAYAAATGQECFFPEVALAFTIEEGRGHYHLPLLLSPYAYQTYRGS